jgi:hypothetical protein
MQMPDKAIQESWELGSNAILTREPHPQKQERKEFSIDEAIEIDETHEQSVKQFVSSVPTDGGMQNEGSDEQRDKGAAALDSHGFHAIVPSFSPSDV